MDTEYKTIEQIIDEGFKEGKNVLKQIAVIII